MTTRCMGAALTALLLWASPAAAQEPTTAASASLAGVVRHGATGAPVAGASLSLPDVRREATSDSVGRFRLDGLRAGRVAVLVRLPGFAPLQDTVELAAGRVTERTFAMMPIARLDSVTVTGADLRELPPSLRGFEERQRRGSGTFVPEAEMRKMDGKSLGRALPQRIPGVRAVVTGSRTFLVSSRATTTGRDGLAFGRSRTGADHCYVTVYVDGALYYDGTSVGAPPPDFDRLEARDFAAAEFHTAATLPPGYPRTSAGCGWLLLYTRVR